MGAQLAQCHLGIILVPGGHPAGGLSQAKIDLIPLKPDGMEPVFSQPGLIDNAVVQDQPEDPAVPVDNNVSGRGADGDRGVHGLMILNKNIGEPAGGLVMVAHIQGEIGKIGIELALPDTDLRAFGGGLVGHLLKSQPAAGQGPDADKGRQQGGDQAENQNRGKQSINTDPAGPQGQNFIVPGHAQKHQQNRHHSGNGDNQFQEIGQ